MKWVVYEDADATVWNVTPPTKATARREAKAAGTGHRAVPRRWAREMANAYNHGRHSARRKGKR
jgi:hypothetical protein